MYKLSEIKELIKLVDQSSLQELEIQNEGYRLFLRKPSKTESVIVASAPNGQNYAHVSAAPLVQQAVPAAAPVAPVADAAKADDKANLHKIVSPMVGTFYAAPSPDAPAFVKAGDKVSEKSIVCIVEAMKLMNEIEAEFAGKIVSILVENGQPVEFGEPLFVIEA
jgi:acetyl-CoA carboxylase biotin carboxyl carrier protein